MVHEDPGSLPLSKSEADPLLREKLQKFIEKASTGRLRKTWSSAKDLPGLVALSLNKTIKAYPAIGWVRADKVSNETTLLELNELRKRNEELSERVRHLENRPDYKQPENLASLNDIYELSYEISTVGWGYDPNREEHKSLKIEWSNLFSIISPFLTTEATDNEVYDILKSHIEKVAPHSYDHTTIDSQELKTIYLQFKALDLMEHDNVNWKLSSKGIELMMQLRTIKCNS
ncbi:hypothetical protein ACQRKX_003943 [Enterobacter cloacae]